MNQEIVQELTDRARKRFGDDRVPALAEDIVKLAAEIASIRTYPISIDDEP